MLEHACEGCGAEALPKHRDFESLVCHGNGNERAAKGFLPAGEELSMLMTKERRSAIRTRRGWAISVLQEAGAIRECEEHGWMQDRADPHARQRAFDIARQDPPDGLSETEAVAEIEEVFASIGDTCPECPPDC
jgi:hypothetical protein